MPTARAAVLAPLASTPVMAIGDLMFTRAIYMDADLNGWGRRFCFENRALADSEFQRITSGGQEPVGWIASR